MQTRINPRSLEYLRYQDALRRSLPKDEPHPARTGFESKFTSSKAQGACPHPFAPEVKAGAKGIYCGDIATKGGWYPKEKSKVREFLHGMVFESHSEGGSWQMELGNLQEAPILEVVRRIYPYCLITTTGRTAPTPEGVQWMAATPDFYMYDPAEDKAWCGEIKTFAQRVPEMVPHAAETATQIPSLGKPFLQPECLTDWDGTPNTNVLEFESVWVVSDTLVPGEYVMQALLHTKVSEIPRCLFVQYEIGGEWRNPVVHFTRWDCDERLWNKMFPYWEALWRIGEKGREMHRTYIKAIKDAQAAGNEARFDKAEQLFQRFRDEFPWDPKEESTNGRRVPFTFDE